MRVAWLLIVFVITASSAHADAPLPNKTDRLVALGRVWVHAKYFHPTLATRDIDWDAALVAAIPKVEAATTAAQYKAAVQSMLAVLGDPTTRVEDTKPDPAPAAATGDWQAWPAPDVLEVRLSALTSGEFDFVGVRQKARQVVTDAAKATALVIDLRGAKGEVPFVLEEMSGAFPGFDEWPTSRVIEHRGYRTQSGTTSGDYFSTFIIVGARPPHPAPKAGPAHVVFVADGDAIVSSYALALQAAGKATIVASGGLSPETGLDGSAIDIGAGLTAHVRISELMWGPPRADVTLPAGKDVLARARQIAKKPPKAAKRVKRAPALLPLRLRDDLDYADTPYPSRERRLLAGIRLWGVIDNFFPYRYLIADWDAALRDALSRLDTATDTDSYLRALREMAVRTGDGHVGVSPATRSPRGIPPFEVRLVEGKLTVVRALGGAGVAVGDVIETIDGKPVAERIADQRKVTSGSTDEARDQRTAGAVVAGDDGSTAKLGVRDARNKLREVTVTRKKENFAPLMTRTGPHWKKLPGNIGYVDLRDLTVPEVAKMMSELATTKAIVFDMRGYPNGTAWAIAPRLNVRRAKHAAEFLAPQVQAQGVLQNLDLRTRFIQPIPPAPPGTTLYAGKVVMLIDDRAISQSEHTCLFLKEATNVTFVGSPTHGANGDVTVMRLPGGLRMSLTGQEVRHVDGKQLQRVGIQPHITVRPTLAGIRAGKDEVLDRALGFLATGK